MGLLSILEVGHQKVLAPLDLHRSMNISLCLARRNLALIQAETSIVAYPSGTTSYERAFAGDRRGCAAAVSTRLPFAWCLSICVEPLAARLMAIFLLS